MPVRTSGALFSGAADSMVRAAVETDVRAAVSGRALKEIQVGTRVFKRPTPIYSVTLSILKHPAADLVTDHGIIYGPVLERGHPFTSFDGYHLWEKATNRTTKAVESVVTEALAPVVWKVNL